MQKLPILKPGDTIELIAPASCLLPEQLSGVIKVLESWGLNCIVDKNIFGGDLLCANSDELRFQSLKNALLRPETKAIICVRGGYGSLRLIPALTEVSPPNDCKIFIGMSDITALNTYIQQQWNWPVVHGALALDKFSPESVERLNSILFGNTIKTTFDGLVLNSLGKANHSITAFITGGNLSLVQASIGTSWQLNSQGKIMFLEEVGERGYRVDRMLEHLYQANLFTGARAIVFGDFLEGKEPNGTSLIHAVLERFAKMRSTVPVIKIEGIGHGYHNFPIVLGAEATLELNNENEVKLTCYR